MARFVEATLKAEVRARLLVHLAACDECREVVAIAVSGREPIVKSWR